VIDINTLFIALPVGNVLNSEFYLEQLPWLQAFSCGATRRIAGLSKISVCCLFRFSPNIIYFP
jgi:hypothetical protein